jgi:hypothetical protein
METKKAVTYYVPVMPITLILLILKLSGAVQISWFWVFFPLWIVPAIMLGIFALVVACGLLALLVSGITK